MSYIYLRAVIPELPLRWYSLVSEQLSTMRLTYNTCECTRLNIGGLSIVNYHDFRVLISRGINDLASTSNILFPPQDRAWDHRSLLHTDAYRGTDMLEQLARSAASCMVILGNIRRSRWQFSVFPLYFYPSHWRSRGFESAGKRHRLKAGGGDPARSTRFPHLWGILV